jgi:hypothetical protein
MFVRFTEGGIGHPNTAKATKKFREVLLKLFDLYFNNDTSNDNHSDGDNLEDGSHHHHDSDAPEWEDIQSDVDDNDGDDVCTDFEDDGGECGADKEDELGFGGF